MKCQLQLHIGVYSLQHIVLVHVHVKGINVMFWECVVDVPVTL